MQIGDSSNSARYFHVERNSVRMGSIHSENSRMNIQSYNNKSLALLNDSSNGLFITDSDELGIFTTTNFGSTVAIASDNFGGPGSSGNLIAKLWSADATTPSNSRIMQIGAYSGGAMYLQVYDNSNWANRRPLVFNPASGDGGNVGIGLTNPTGGRLHIDQSNSSGAVPVLCLDQGDIDDSFINFIGTSAADGSRSISTDTTEDSAKYGAIRIEINGTTKWIRIYDSES